MLALSSFVNEPSSTLSLNFNVPYGPTALHRIFPNPKGDFSGLEYCTSLKLYITLWISSFVVRIVSVIQYFYLFVSVLSSPGIESLSEELKVVFSGALLTVLHVTLDLLLLVISCRYFLLENYPLLGMYELFLVALPVFFLLPF